MNRFIKQITTLMVALALSLPAFAITLQEAKQQGKVGEMPNGYLGIVVASGEVTELVKSVNNKRKKLYIQLAKKNKLTLKQVAQLAGEKALNKTKAGHYIKDANGQWVKK